MNNVIGVYQNHEDALTAILNLKKNGFEIKHLSLLGKAGEEIIENYPDQNNKIQIITKDPIKINSIATVAILGSIVGLLSGAGLFLIPGLGILFGAGALVGAIAGFDVGLLVGGITALLTVDDIKEEFGMHFEHLLDIGKLLLIAHETEEEIERAHDILHTNSLIM